MATSKTAAKPARVGNHPGSYFLSLTVENVRCFGPAQTLDLSDGHGRHAPWTIILGENGLGKTTLLTSLALSGSYVHFFRRHSIYLEDQLRGRDPNIDNLRSVPYFKPAVEIFHVHMGLRRGDDRGTIELVVTSDDIAKATETVQINIHPDSETDATCPPGRAPRIGARWS